MDLIRQNPESKSRVDPKNEKIEREIIECVTSRLMRLPASVLIVPCGDVARAMVGKIKPAVIEGNPTLEFHGGEVPHPSYGHWSGDKYKAVMEALGEVLRTRLCRRAT